jgi:hypothetical protein
MDSDSKASKMNMGSLMTINKLKYALPSNMNVSERRTNKISFADQNAYLSSAGNEVVIRMTASTDYVYGPNCYLVFDIQTAGGDPGNNPPDKHGFLRNTAMSLFSRSLFEDKSGAEVERNDSLGRYVAQVSPLHWSTEYTTTGVAMAGQAQSSYPFDPTATPPTYLPNGNVDNYDCRASPLTVCIPLRWFLGVFNNETLIPSTLISGALLRLQLASVGEAFEQANGDVQPTSYTITNPRVVLDSISLAPVVQKNLMEQSQSGGGLDYVYETVYYQSGNPGTSSNFNLQVNKAVSRCQKLYWSNRAQNTPVNSLKDNLGTALLNVNQLDYRLGDLYFPQRVISVTGSPQKNGAELYENTLQSIHRMKTNEDPPSVSKNSFCNDGVAVQNEAGNANNDNSGRAVHCQSFEMSSALSFSGLAINNSRTLEARINFVAPAGPQ